MRVQSLFLALAVCASAVDGSFPRDVLPAGLELGLSRAVDGLMAAVGNGTSYRLNGLLTVTVARPDGRERTDGDGALARVLELFNALRVRYQPENGADDEFTEGRGKKKNKDKKHKMGMMMGAAAMGMTVIGGMAMKMMMGGVTMIAMKALIIAKLALLLASVIALKKLIGGGGSGGSAGGGVAGPAWNGGGGGGVDVGGYRRSYGAQADDASAATAEHSLSAANALAYKEQIGNSYGRL